MDDATPNPYAELLAETAPIENFVTESNLLAGRYNYEPDVTELNGYRMLLKAPTLNTSNLTYLATALSGGAIVEPEKLKQFVELLTQVNLGVEAIERDLSKVLLRYRAEIREQQRAWLAYTLHRAIHELQPFRGGNEGSPIGVNGLIGRAAWLWVMNDLLEGPFLTTWYQQSLRFGGVAEIRKDA